jgi:hypothetical protein
MILERAAVSQREGYAVRYLMGDAKECAAWERSTVLVNSESLLCAKSTHFLR